jgi:hypothetical protein
VDVLISLRPFIWGLVSGLMQFRDTQQRNNIKFCANLRKRVTQTLAVIRQAAREENMSCTRVSEWRYWFRAENQVKSKVKSMLIISFHIQGILHKESVLAA